MNIDIINIPLAPPTEEKTTAERLAMTGIPNLTTVRDTDLNINFVYMEEMWYQYKN
jgi:hypothetical protein